MTLSHCANPVYFFPTSIAYLGLCHRLLMIHAHHKYIFLRFSQLASYNWSIILCCGTRWRQQNRGKKMNKKKTIYWVVQMWSQSQWKTNKYELMQDKVQVSTKHNRGKANHRRDIPRTGLYCCNFTYRI